MRFSVHDILWSNVNDVAANGGGRIEGEGLVLVNGEGIELSLVDCPLVHCVLNRGVNQLATGCVCMCLCMHGHANVCVHVCVGVKVTTDWVAGGSVDDCLRYQLLLH